MSTAWGYGASDGPGSWAHNFPDARGERQSPIDIVTSKAQYDAVLTDKPLKMDYRPEEKMCISNTGASVKADCEKDSTLTGGPLGDNVYKLIQFHLHWGKTDDKGAEHTIDGKVYSAEVGNPHKGFELVSRELNNTLFKDDCCSASESFDPTCLLPGNTKKFWTYPGSLTTPPCYESVQFILFQEPIEFSAQQMKSLRSMHFGRENSECMMDNYRPVCFIGTRTVRASFTQ